MATSTAKYLARAGAAAALAGTVLIGAAGTPGRAVITNNTIGPTGILAPNGRAVQVDALVTCTEGERVAIEVTVTQGAAYGRGQTHGWCTGEETTYPVRIHARRGTTFAPGPAQACVLAVNTDPGRVVDTRQWCRADPVTLEEGTLEEETLEEEASPEDPRGRGHGRDRGGKCENAPGATEEATPSDRQKPHPGRGGAGRCKHWRGFVPGAQTSHE